MGAENERAGWGAGSEDCADAHDRSRILDRALSLDTRQGKKRPRRRRGTSSSEEVARWREE